MSPKVRGAVASSRRGVVRKVGRAVSRVPGAGIALAPTRTASFALNTFLRGGCGPVGPGFPKARLSAALAAQVALDEALLGFMRNPSRYPTRKDWERMGGDLTETLAYYQAQGWDEAPASYHATPPPLEKPSIRRGGAWGLGYERLWWPSEYEPHDGEPRRDDWMSFTKNETAHAYVVRSGEHRPWLVCLHGFGVGYAVADFVAFRAPHLAKELGLNLIFPVFPLHGPRRTGAFGGAELLSHQMHRWVIGMGHAIWDIRRAISWARTQNPRVGVYGMSLGGYVASLLAALEPNLDVAIAGAPVTDLPSLLGSHIPEKVVRKGEDYGVSLETLREGFRVVSPLAMKPLLGPEDLYVFAGLGDRMAPPEQARLLIDHWRTPKAEWYDGAHLAFLWSGKINRFIDSALRDRLLRSPGSGGRPLTSVAF